MFKAKKAAVVATPTTFLGVVAAMPTPPVLFAACMIPTLLGFWKSEYGVSYAYALATLAAGALVIKAAKTNVAALHAGCLCLYGLRLGLFLVYRELTISRFREFRDKIETRATERGSRLARTPFILACRSARARSLPPRPFYCSSCRAVRLRSMTGCTCRACMHCPWVHASCVPEVYVCRGPHLSS